jgi:hypothetical protein
VWIVGRLSLLRSAFWCFSSAFVVFYLISKFRI